MARRKAEADTSEFGIGLIEALEDVAAHRRGEISLPMRIVDPMPPETIRAIRRKAAKTRGEFAARFGVPAGTIEGWETGRRKPDLPARVLLRVIAHDPDAVEAALTD